ncbi:MAG: hypothetical protein FWH27_11415 [Planctomycetaceae bacterium]|nr:hypothetical protein [Planctomycetaceae bacterium]
MFAQPVTTVNLNITFCQPAIYSFADTVSSSDNNLINNDYETWRKKAVHDEFSACLVYLFDIVPDEKTFPLESFIISPMLWGTTIKADISRIREAFIMKIKNKKNNQEYFLCISKRLRSHENSYWLPQASAISNNISHHSLLRVEPNKNIFDQLCKYLQIVDFGPNNWSGERCGELKIFLPESERKLFILPIITDDLKKERAQKLENLSMDYMPELVREF